MHPIDTHPVIGYMVLGFGALIILAVLFFFCREICWWCDDDMPDEWSFDQAKENEQKMLVLTGQN